MKSSSSCVAGVGLRRAAPVADEIEPRLHALQDRGHLVDRVPNFVAERRAGVLDHFERAGKNLVRANDLNAQPLDGIREHAVHFLRLAARHARRLPPRRP